MQCGWAVEVPFPQAGFGQTRDVQCNRPAVRAVKVWVRPIRTGMGGMQGADLYLCKDHDPNRTDITDKADVNDSGTK